MCLLLALGALSGCVCIDAFCTPFIRIVEAIGEVSEACSNARCLGAPQPLQERVTVAGALVDELPAAPPVPADMPH